MRCSGRWCRLLLIAALIATALADLGAQPAPTDAVIAVILDSDVASIRERAAVAARESVADYSRWFGPRPARPLAVTGVPWRSSPETMDVESLVAYELARGWWFDQFGDSPVVNGVAWYLQSRVVERLYDLTFMQPGHSADSVRFFGGAISWSFPILRLSRWSGGLARAEWQGARRRWPFTGRRLPPSLDDQALGVAIDLTSFEHTAGWPALQAALAGAANTAPTARALADVLNDAAGLTLVTPVSESVADPAIVSVTTTRCVDRPCELTRVTISRDGVTNAESMPIRVDFADGRYVTALVGSDRHDVEFESAAPYTSVQLDGERMMLSDANLLNNIRLSSPVSNVPTTKWLVRWVVWLEDAMLSYSALF